MKTLQCKGKRKMFNVHCVKRNTYHRHKLYFFSKQKKCSKINILIHDHNLTLNTIQWMFYTFLTQKEKENTKAANLKLKQKHF